MVDLTILVSLKFYRSRGYAPAIGVPKLPGSSQKPLIKSEKFPQVSTWIDKIFLVPNRRAKYMPNR
jgi:hypothetical protein